MKLLKSGTTSLLAVAAGAVTIVYAGPQEQPTPRFEVASIKPNNSGDGRVMIGPSPGRFNAVNVTLRMLMRTAYRVQDYQITGGAGWIGTDRFDIDAKTEGPPVRLEPCFGPSCPPDPMQLMLQNLLADRFQLKIHRETRESPVYELSIANSGLKLQAVAAPERPQRGAAAPPPPPPPVPPAPGGPLPAPPPGAIMIGRGQLAGGAMPFGSFVQALSQQLDRPVIDKTGLTGFFDFRLTWTPEAGLGAPGLGGPPGPGGPEPVPTANPAGPSIFTAIQEQLGLKLDSARGPVEMIVIDSVSKPSEN